MPCKGICYKHKGKKEGSTNIHYVQGQKRCTECAIFIIWDSIYCPCCGYKLRTRSFRGLGIRKYHRESTLKRY